MAGRSSQEANVGPKPPYRPRARGPWQHRGPVKDGVAGGGYRDPDDTPSVEGIHPLWPTGPCLPRWAENELLARNDPDHWNIRKRRLT